MISRGIFDEVNFKVINNWLQWKTFQDFYNFVRKLSKFLFRIFKTEDLKIFMKNITKHKKIIKNLLVYQNNNFKFNIHLLILEICLNFDNFYKDFEAVNKLY